MKVRELFTDASKWAKGAEARNSDGLRTQFDSPFAVSWCLGGALAKCYPNTYPSLRVEVQMQMGIRHISVWNDADNRTFEEVKELVDRLDL